jgi:Flp pilus assembly protein CpaB
VEKKALIVALAVAVIGFGLLQLYMHNFELEATGGEKVGVVVVTRDLQVGDTLQRGSLALRRLPRSYLESRHIHASDLDRVLGQKLGQSTKANESLLWTDLESLAPTTSTLSTLVREGMRAATIRVPQGSFGNLLRPGDRVDVLLVASTASAHPQALSARTLLENVQVLAVGGQLGGAAASAAAARGGDTSQLTVSVTIEQGRELAIAETQGSLRILLRNPDEITTTVAASAR